MARDEAGDRPQHPEGHDKEAPGAATADQRLIDRAVPLRATVHRETQAARRTAALIRRADRLRRESAQLRQRVAALGLFPPAADPAPAQQVEALRRALLRVRARVRALEALAQGGSLPPAAGAKLEVLRLEVAHLWDALRQIIREQPPDDSD